MLRYLARERIPTIAGMITLAVGFGLAVTTATLGYRLFLRPLPYPNAKRLVHISQVFPLSPESAVTMSGFWLYAKEHTRTLSGLAAWRESEMAFAHASQSRSITAAYISRQTPEVLGLTVSGGRLFTTEEERLPQPDACLITQSLAARLGLRPEQVSGVGLKLDGKPVRVVGVVPEGFVFPASRQPDVYLPLEGLTEKWHRSRVTVALTLIGRIGPTENAHSVTAELSGLYERYLSLSGRAGILADSRIRVTSLASWLHRKSVRPLALMAVIAGVLFTLAWFNVSSLEVAKTLSRLHDFAIRNALGATSPRLLRLGATRVLPTVGPAAVGGAVLTVAGKWHIESFVGIDAYPNPGAPELLLLVAALLATGSLVSVAIIPVAVCSHLNPLALLQGSGAQFPRGATRAMRGLLAAQISVSIVATFLCVVLLRSLAASLAIEPGFEATGVSALRLSVSDEQYPDQQARRLLYERIRRRLEEVPAVKAVGFMTPLPLEGVVSTQPVRVLAGRGSPEQVITDVGIVYASREVFSILKLRVRAGTIPEQPPAGVAERIAYSNHAFASRLPTEGGKVDRLVQTAEDLGRPPRLLRAIYADVRQLGLERDVGPQLILPFEEEAPLEFGLLVRCERTWTSLRDLEKAIWEVDPTLTIRSSMLLSQRLSQELAPKLLQSGLLGLVMVVALCMVGLCVYGLVWSTVERSRRELAIRMAVGATPAGLRRGMVLRLAGWWVCGAGGGVTVTVLVWSWLQSVFSELQSPGAGAVMITLLVSLSGTLGAAWLGTRKLKSVAISDILRVT